MKSTYVTGGLKGRIEQYNNLMDDARASSYLIPHEQESPNLTVEVEPGNMYNNELFINFEGGTSPVFTAPTTNPRIDILALSSNYQDQPDFIMQSLSNTYDQAGNACYWGQTFIPRKNNFVFKTVTFKLQKGPDTGTSRDVKIQLYATSGGVPTGSPLAELVTNSGSIPTSEGEVTYAVPETSLTKDVMYAIVFNIPTWNTSGTHYWVRGFYNNVDVYTDGTRLSSSTVAESGQDMHCIIGYDFTEAPDLVILSGVPAVSPIAPLVPENYIPICEVYNRVGQTSIRDTDISPNDQGYIHNDRRPFLQTQSTQNLKKRFIAGENINKGDAVVVAAALPETTVLVNTSAVNSYAYLEDGASMGQIFTTSAKHKTLTSIGILAQETPRSTTERLRLYAVSGGVATGSIIAEVSQNMSSHNNQVWHIFTFPTPPTLSPNTQYAFFFTTTDPDDGVSWYFNTVNPYGGGYRLTGDFPGTPDTERETSFQINEILTTTGAVYKGDADAATSDYYNNIIGIADESITVGGTGLIVIAGVSANHTNLIVGQTYYLSNTSGALSTTAGSNSRKLGIAISGTELMLIRDNV